MSKNLIDVLDKIPQYDVAEYAADLVCPDCGKSGFFDVDTKPNLIGWAETSNGYQAIFECPICGKKYRFHCGGNVIDNLEQFDFKLYFWAKKCLNWSEIEGLLYQG